jgi:hypothetical protein
MQDVRQGAESHATIAAFDGAQRRSRHPGSLRHAGGREPAPLTRKAQILTQLGEQAADSRQ